MGRYYYGDIEGKFMFAVQNSDAADRFGVIGQQPMELNYFFEEDDLETIQLELQTIESTLGDNLQKMIDFNEQNDFYNDDMLSEFLGVDKEDLHTILSEFADWRLGKEIEEKVLEDGQCEFTAEIW